MEEIIERVNKLALEEIKKYGGPSLPHYNLSLSKVDDVVKKVGKDKVDSNIVKLGVMLMDIKLGEAIKKGKASEHIKMSVEYAKQILDCFKLDGKTKENVLNCIEAHHGTVQFKSIEAEICANLDCYRFIYPQGVFTYIQTVTGWGKSQNEAIDMVLEKMEEKHNVLSLEVCKKELEPLYQKIKKLLIMSKI